MMSGDPEIRDLQDEIRWRITMRFPAWFTPSHDQIAECCGDLLEELRKRLHTLHHHTPISC